MTCGSRPCRAGGLSAAALPLMLAVASCSPAAATPSTAPTPRAGPAPAEGERPTPQREAVRYLGEHAFRVPAWLVDPTILRRIEQEGVVQRVRTAQANVLGTLLDETRLNRLVDYEALARAGESYTVAELLADVRQGAWTELTAANPQIDVFRRNLQRAFLEVVDRQLNPPTTPLSPQPGPFGQQQPPRPRFASDARAVLRGELAELSQLAQRALGRTSDPMTRLHLRDVRMEIERILEPRGQRSG